MHLTPKRMSGCNLCESYGETSHVFPEIVLDNHPHWSGYPFRLSIFEYLSKCLSVFDNFCIKFRHHKDTKMIDLLKKILISGGIGILFVCLLHDLLSKLSYFCMLTEFITSCFFVRNFNHWA